MCLNDFRLAWRLLLNRPGFSALIIGTLGISIGACCAILSLVQSVLVQSLPYAEPSRLVVAWENHLERSVEWTTVAPANLVDWQRENAAFERIIAIETSAFDITGAAEPVRVQGAVVSSSFFELLGTPLALGSGFAGTESGMENVVIVSDGFWRRSLGADPQAIGRRLILNQEPYTLAGVTPAGFRAFPTGAEIWTPARWNPETLNERKNHYLIALGRLAPGISLEAAQASMDSIATRLAQTYPDTNEGWGVTLVPLQEQIVAGSRPTLFGLLGAFAALLLIAICNLTALFLARSQTRQREFAVRLALGARRLRLIPQLFAENLLMTLLSGALGLAFAHLIIRSLPALGIDIPRLEESRVGGAVFASALGISLLVGLLFSLLAVAYLARTNPRAHVQAATPRASADCGADVFRRVLIVAELTLALILGIAATLIITSYREAVSVDLGFESESLVTGRVSLPRYRYSEPHDREAFVRRVLEELENHPRVASAATSLTVPMTGFRFDAGFMVDGEPDKTGGEPTGTRFNAISPAYFETMGVELVDGRGIDPTDAGDSAPVAIINETMRNRYWRESEVIGRHLILAGHEPARFQIVGVIQDVKQGDLRDTPEPMVYVPYFQRQRWQRNSSMSFVLQGESSVEVAVALREAIWRVDPHQVIFGVATLGELIAEWSSGIRSGAFLMGLCAFFSLLLAVLGVYGIVSFMIGQRTHELAIRMSFGATPAQITKMILRHAFGLSLSGLVFGLVGIFALRRFMERFLFEVSASEPTILAAQCATLVVLVLLAALLPARRIILLHPATLLKRD